jgi:hypothetical protein
MRETTDVDIIDREIRSTQAYDQWVLYNKALCCHICSCEDPAKLELHHNPDFHTIIRNEYRVLRDWALVKESLIAKHINNTIDCITFCKDCHDKFHGGRINRSSHVRKEAKTELWCVIPRNLDDMITRFSYSRKDKDPSALGLIPFQILLGIGWHVVNKEVVAKKIAVDIWDFARLIGKKAGTSWHKSFLDGLDSLKVLGFLDDYNCSIENSREFTLTLSRLYTEETKLNPWFLPLISIKTKNMLTLVLTWYLCTKQTKQTHEIYVRNLATYLGVMDKRADHLGIRVQYAANPISLLKTIEVREGIQGKKFRFTMNMYKESTPIHTLRKKLVNL